MLEQLAKDVRALEERMQSVEVDRSEAQLRVLDAAERVAHRLRDRTRKRSEAAAEPEEPSEDAYGHALGFRRRFHNDGGES